MNYIKKFIRFNINKKRSNIDKTIKFNNTLLNRTNLTYFIRSFGNKNKNKTFYVIQRFRGGGMFSNLNFVIHHLLIAKNLDLIPIIDMMNFPTKYNEKNKINNTLNAWDYYFHPINKYNLDEVYKSHRVIIADGQTKGNIEFDKFTNLNDDHFKIYKQLIKFKPFLINEVSSFEKKNFLKEKVLGVHFRGTDMKTQERHPFPATPKQIIFLIHKELNKNKYSKIFLVTEESRYVEILSKEFGNKICFTNAFRSEKHNIFEQNFRKNHRFKIGKENIVDMLLLSKTKKIICTNSHLPDACKFINRRKKIEFLEVNNGYNSNNVLIAQYLWYIKSILPVNLGGFDKCP
tara:strand:+ start:2045 stop:3082 length:1038 start_codon:yes stop_codon:yes gene_type:complete